MGRSPLLWFAEEGSVAVNGVLYTTRVTDIEVRGCRREADQINTFGGNALLAERPQEVAETQITSIVSGMQFSQLVFGAGSTTSGGILVSGMGTRSKANIVYSWADPTDGSSKLRIRFSSGFGIETTMTLGTDNELRETLTFKCLARDCYREFSSGNALILPPL